MAKSRINWPWLFRTIHIYLSMFGLIILLFFAVTGFTLNRVEWFAGDSEDRQTLTGEFPADVLARGDTFEIVEHIRANFPVRGAVTSFQGEPDDYEVRVVFKRPGALAEAAIDRETHKIEVVIESYGAVAFVNDLHLGRDSGAGWKLAIDFTALLMVLVSLTGLVLIFTMRKGRTQRLITAGVGLLFFVLVYVVFVP
jgi:hypothetical protein